MVLFISTGCSSSGKKTPATSATSTAAAAATTTAGSTSSASSGGGGLVGVDYPRSDTDFWNSYISYVPKFASSLGVTIKTTNSQNDVQKLVANVQALRGQGAKAIVMAPQDTAAIGPELSTLNSQKVPVVTIDTRPDTGNVVYGRSRRQQGVRDEGL